MKIARIIESFYPYMSGPANQAFQISKRLKGKSKIFTTFYKAKDAKQKEIMDGIEIERFRIKASVMKYLYTPKMQKAIVKFCPDVIHAHNYRSYQTELAYKVSRKLNIPFIVNTHGSLLGYDSITKGIKKLPYKGYDLWGKKAIVNADAVIVNSKQEYKEALQFGVSRKHLFLIPMGIDTKKYTVIPKNKTKNTLLFVGRITRDRNLMPILQALIKLDSYKLKIVGPTAKRTDTEKDGYIDELKDYVKKNDLDVEFCGPKYGVELVKEYRSANIFVYTSLWENFGQTILEAAAAGLPIISTNVGVAPEILENKYITGSPETIARRIKELDEKETTRVQKLIKQKVDKNFNWNSIAKKYEAVYKSVLR